MQHDEKNYHHGNLKQALVDAYLELIPLVPAEKLSLRRVAKHVGVAPTAVYNHFPDKVALTVAVKFKCLEHFAEFLESGASDNLEPEERIQLLGQNYYQYSIDFPYFYDYIFQHDVAPEYLTQELIDVSMRAEAELRSAVISLLKKHNIPQTKYNEGLGAFACWSMAHGVTSLAARYVNNAACMAGRWPDEFMLQGPEAVKSSFKSMTNVLVAGILSAAEKIG